MNYKYFIKFIFPLSVFLILILYLSLLPHTKTISTITPKLAIPDTFQHIFAYSFLSILFFRLFDNSNLKDKAIFLAILFAFSYGLTAEILQILTSTRDFSLKDITTNFLGSCIILFKGLLK